MKVSNITYSSNVYVIHDGGGVHDEKFLNHVLDPAAIRKIIIEYNEAAANLSEVQQTIYKNYLPCAFGNGDRTHGAIFENGKIIFVNRCENTACKLYPKCSAKSDFRKIERLGGGIFDFKAKAPKEQEPLRFESGTWGQTRIPKPIKIKKLERKTIITKVEESVHTGHTLQQWSVRPHVRRLPGGETTWVRGHYRRHWAYGDLVVRFEKSSVPRVFTCKDAEKANKLLSFRKCLRGASIISEDIQPKDTQRKGVSFISEDFSPSNIKIIENEEKIIKSDIKSKILVNSGPGTGKTHTVIERLKELTRREDEISAENIFVLCFSRSAVSVINSRLEQAINNEEIPPSARNVNIATLDSFATWFLRESNPDGSLSRLNYDDRIRKCIREYKSHPQDLADAVGYLIIDEIQDFIKERAELIQALLENLKCGFLLLGDSCQAIFDYQIKRSSELSFKRLYRWIKDSFGDLKEYELAHNHRNEGAIGDSLKPLRRAMLHRPLDEQEAAVSELIKKYGTKESSVKDIRNFPCKGGQTRAVLTRANGAAYRLSNELYELGEPVAHRLLTGVKRLSYRREIADILSGYTEEYISRGKFCKLAEERGVSGELAKLLWEGFEKVLNEDDLERIDLRKLKRAMFYEKRVAECLLCPADANIFISTIHKAKGREFDDVIVRKSSDISSSDEIKVYYVAMTRAKSRLTVEIESKKCRDIKTDSDRHAEISRGKIKRMELGLDGDIDPISFVLCDNPAERQKYIAEKVKRGDPIKINRRDERYYIVHNEHYIGEVNPEAFIPLTKGRRTYTTEDFVGYDELYVSDVVTVVNQRLAEGMADEYKKCGFWYGIEFCGYARAKEE